jgi:hypothetical protein
MVLLLLQKCFNPNLPLSQDIGFINPTVWTYFLVHQWERGRIAYFFHITKALLMHGADVNASLSIHGEPTTAAELAKRLLLPDQPRELEPFLNPRLKAVQRARGHESKRKRFIKSVFGLREGK